MREGPLRPAPLHATAWIHPATGRTTGNGAAQHVRDVLQNPWCRF